MLWARASSMPGVSEQNMVSVAAGLARSGLRPWTYSIAPFLYARPFEQIRNDVCFHHLPVIMVGNGGGYGYGVMGSSHHALEDYGCLLTLPHMRAFVPAFDSDVSTMIPMLMQCDGPVYLTAGVVGRAQRAGLFLSMLRGANCFAAMARFWPAWDRWWAAC